MELYDEGWADCFIVTGGKLPDDRTTEADVARGWAIAHGVPPEAILVEDEGRTTLESLEAVQRSSRRGAADRPLRQRRDAHAPGAADGRRTSGIEALRLADPDQPGDIDPRRRGSARCVHEIAGLAAYYVGGGRLFGDARSPAP